MALRERGKAALSSIGLLDPQRAGVAAARRRKRNRYIRRLVSVYADPLSTTYETVNDPYFKTDDEHSTRLLDDKRAVATSLLRALARWPGSPGSVENLEAAGGSPEGSPILRALGAVLSETDTSAARLADSIASSEIELPTEGAAADLDPSRPIEVLLDRVIDSSLAPHYYDYDYVDDLEGIVGARYRSPPRPPEESSTWVFDTLRALTGAGPDSSVRDTIEGTKKLLGDVRKYTPERGDVSDHVRKVIPDLVDEFVALKAESDVERFLFINREYSRRQFTEQGSWDNRDLSLLREHEYDHHLLLRTLAGLKRDGMLERGDEVLVVGPRHIDEIHFFRKHLGLPQTIGLDLFGSSDGSIISGDMHDMPFDRGRFKMIFSAGTLSYGYYSRKIIEEMARVAERPGYVFLMDAANRHTGPDALGRSDDINVDILTGLFYRHRYNVLPRDRGRSLDPQRYAEEPCLALELN